MKTCAPRSLVVILALACSGGAGPPDEDRHWQKAYDAGSLALKTKQFGEAERLFKVAVELSRRYGKDDWRYDHSLHCLACAYSPQGKFEQAVMVRKEILSNTENARKAPTASELANRLNNLATDYRDWGKYDQAGPLYERALEILEQHPEADPLSFSVVLTNQAKLFRAQGRFAEAEHNLQRALPYQIKWSGGEKGYVSWVLDEYAELLHSSGRRDEARALQVRSLTIKVSDNQRYAEEARRRGQIEDVRKYEKRLEELKEELAERGR
jgi:tetratricopeptide (TPR) repeat protein